MAAENAQTDGIPLTDRERRIWADIEWADHNEEIQAKYAGEWLALYERTVVAHGPDREQVLREAAAVTQQPPEALALWPVLDRVAFLGDSPVSAAEL